MSPTVRMNRETVAQDAAETKGFVDTFSALYTTGIARIAEIQKRSIDLAVAQNAELTGAWKKILQKMPGAPAFTLLDMAHSALERYADTGKSTIDMMVEQGNALAETTKENVAAVTKASENAINLAQQTAERALATQKKVLDQSAAQTKVAVDTLKQQVGAAGWPVEFAADSFNRGVDAVIEAQKELLNIAAH